MNDVPERPRIKPYEKPEQKRQRLDKEDKSARFMRRKERMKNVQQMTAVPRVRVLPASDEIRKAIKHPRGNIAFRESGSVEWPMDQFTRRRLNDGTVTLEEQQPEGQVARRPGERVKTSTTT